VLVALSLGVGAYTIAPGDLLAALVGQGSAGDRFVVLQLRLPRVVMAILAGTAFALAGALFQTLSRNPLASPDIIGVTQGAAVAAVGATLVLGWSGAAVSGAAFLGALLAAGLLAALSWRSGIGGYRFVLVGIGLAFLAQAGIGYLLTRADVRDAQAALVWLVGSLSGASWADIAVTAITLGVLLPLTWLVASRLRILQLGDDTATGLGVRAGPARLAVLALAAGLAAIAVAAVGPVAFVAFVAAPVARRALRTGGLALVPSALVGILLVLTADFAAQHLLPGDLEVPVGIVTGIIGAPYLLWLLIRTDRTRE
jgi:iron complex transport system permease protein